jgi:hypothetical protein
LSAITVIYCLTSFGGMQTLFRDSDTGWHIRNGEAILAQGEVPRRDPFSFSKPAQPWFAWEWLADITMAKLHQWDGMRAVFCFYLVVLGVVSWLWFQLMWTAGAWFLAACLSSWVMLTTCNIHWLARPHLIGWVFLLLAVLAAERAPDRLRPLGVALAFGGGALWANIHGSFFLATAIFGLYALEAWLKSFLDGNRRWQPLAAWAAALTLGSFVNPYGWHVHEHIFLYLRDKELLSRIGEFQSFNFHVDGAEAIVIGMTLLASGIALNIQQGFFARGILCLVMFAGALQAARGLPLMALVGLPLAIGAICRAIETAGLPARFDAWRDSLVQYNRNLRVLDANFRGLALAPVFYLLLFAAARPPLFAKDAGFPENQFPVVLAAQIEKLPASARLFSSDKFGGYMLYRFSAKRKVFFDGRSDYYGSDFLKDYLLLPEAKPGWKKQWDRWGFTHALVSKEIALAEALRDIGWKEIGKDEVAILFEKGPQ